MKKFTLVIVVLFCLGIGAGKAQYAVIYNFNGSSGTYGNEPYGDVTLSNGTLYGMTFLGGTSFVGNVFSVSTNGSNPTDLYDFTGGTGDANPEGSFTLIGGTLYGLVPENTPPSYLSGAEFSYALGSGTGGSGGIYTDLYDFNTQQPEGNAEADPEGSLTLLSGNLYGMTTFGGANDSGNIFYTNESGGYTDVYDFGKDYSGNDGAYPNANVTLSVTGDTLFGMTTGGGSQDDDGIIYSFIIGGPAAYTGGTSGNNDGYSILYNFGTASNDGIRPYGSLTLSGGNLYGMTLAGGSYNDGTIFTINTNGSGYSILYNFGTLTNDGYLPNGSLTFSITKDTLFGMASEGGSSSDGVMFRYIIGTSNYDTVFSFTGNTGSYPGENPEGDLTLGPTGDTLYGMTPYGGSNDDGVIFTYTTPSGVTTSVNKTVACPQTVNVYPVPNTGSFTVAGLKQGQIIELYNYIGQKIETQYVASPQSNIQFNISNSANGIYLIRILNKNGSIVTQQKIVKTE